jgi:hypothetical protein
MSKKSVVVQKNKESGWDLKLGREVVKTFKTQAEAWEKGKKLAQKNLTELTVFGRDGRIRSKDSYGKESKKRDTEH